MIATLKSEKMIHWMGNTNLYELSVPYQGFSHVAVMVFPVQYGQWTNAGTEIVGCDENGVVPGDHMVALWQSYIAMDHVDALEVIGYRIA